MHNITSVATCRVYKYKKLCTNFVRLSNFSVINLVVRRTVQYFTEKETRSWFNNKMSSYQYRKSHCGDKTILRLVYLHDGISYTREMASLYWIRAQYFWISMHVVRAFRFYSKLVTSNFPVCTLVNGTGKSTLWPKRQRNDSERNVWLII